MTKKRNIPGLEKRKSKYDDLLKNNEHRDQDFRDDFEVYFKEEVFENEIISKMLPEHKKSYDDGAGSELKEHTYKGKKLPPSMSSVASSSRFCYLSLKDSNLKVFGINNKNHNIKFEEKLPILEDNEKGTPPHMDAFYEDELSGYFFECKCHEQFDSHKIMLRKTYFDSDRIVTKIDKKYYLECNDDKYYKINPSAFGLVDNPRFDIKQFMTHIMGIQKWIEKNKKKAVLIYFYFIPDNVLEEDDIKEVINVLEEEISTIFCHSFFKQHASNIEFKLFFQTSECVEEATIKNTKEKLK